MGKCYMSDFTFDQKKIKGSAFEKRSIQSLTETANAATNIQITEAFGEDALLNKLRDRSAIRAGNIFKKRFGQEIPKKSDIKELVRDTHEKLQGGNLGAMELGKRAEEAKEKLKVQDYIASEEKLLSKRREEDMNLISTYLSGASAGELAARYDTDEAKEALRFWMIGRDDKKGEVFRGNALASGDSSLRIAEYKKILQQVADTNIDAFYDKDENAALSKLGEKYGSICKLASADVFLDKLQSEGSEDDLKFLPIAEIRGRIAFFKELRAHYEDRLKLFSSEFFVLTGSTDLAQYMEEGGDALIAGIRDKAFREYVQLYKRTMESPFAIGKKNRGHLDKLIKDAAAKENLQGFDKREEERWETAGSFRKTSGESKEEGKFKSRFGSRFEELDQMNLDRLTNALVADEYKKSKEFLMMQESLVALQKLTKDRGKIKGEHGEDKGAADFARTIEDAKRAVSYYVFTRGKSLHLKENGMRRLEIAERMELLLTDLSQEAAARVAKLPEKQQRMEEYRALGYDEARIKREEEFHELTRRALDANDVIESGLFGPELQGFSDSKEREKAEKKLKENWVAKGYTQELLRLLGNPEKLRTKEEKNKFLAALMDKNNLLLANKMTVKLVTDSAKDATMGLPALKEDLVQYVNTSLTKDEFLALKPEEMGQRVNVLIAEWKAANTQRTDKIKHRMDQFKAVLPREFDFDDPRFREALLSHSMGSVLFGEASDEEFSQRLTSISTKLTEDERLIDEELKKRYSKLTRDSIKKNIRKNMQALLLLGSTQMVVNQAVYYMNLLQYISPKEYLIERKLDYTCKKLDLPESFRDSLADHLKENAPSILGVEDREDFDWKKWYSLTYVVDFAIKNWQQGDAMLHDGAHAIWNFKARYMGNLHNWHSLLEYKNNDSTLYFTEKQWNDLYALYEQMPTMEMDVFKQRVNEIKSADVAVGEHRISQREYQYGKDFRDEETLPKRRAKAKREEKRIGEIGNSLDKLFLVRLTNADKSDNGHFVKSENILRGEDVLDDRHALESGASGAFIRESRLTELEKVFKEQRIPKAAQRRILERTEPLISGLIETGGRLHSDDRLEFERRNLENYGVKDWETALDKLKEFFPAMSRGEEIEEIASAGSAYEQGFRTLEEYQRGRFKEISGALSVIPEVKAALLTGDKETIEKFMAREVAPRFEPLLQAADSLREGQYHIPALLAQYAFTNASGIWARTHNTDRSFLSEDLLGYGKRFYTKVIAPNMEAAQKRLMDELSAKNKEEAKKKPKRDRRPPELLETAYNAILLMARAELQKDAETSEKFEDLLDADKVYDLMKAKSTELLAARSDREFKKEDFDDKVTNIENLQNGFHVETADDFARLDIGQKRALGKQRFAGYFAPELKKTFEAERGKSLVRAGDGKKTVTLNENAVKRARGYVRSHVTFPLPQVLMDALTEQLASRSFMERSDARGRMLLGGEALSQSVIYTNASAMDLIYKNLLAEQNNDPAMTPEEAQLYIVSLYAKTRNQDMFTHPDRIDMEKIRRTKAYLAFRENYRRLRDFEAEEVSEPSVERERLTMSRTLRTLMATGLSDDEASQKEISAAISKYQNYLTFASKFTTFLRQTVVSDYEKRNREAAEKAQREGREYREYTPSAYYVDNVVLALREYYMDDMLRSLEAGDHFDSAKWGYLVTTFYEKDENRKNILYMKSSVVQEDLDKLDQEKLSGDITEEWLAKAIRQSEVFFTSRQKRYDGLDEDGKKLFALALMHMDKSSLGLNAKGTMALLDAPEAKSVESADVAEQIKNYIEGKEYHFRIDYYRAFRKLVDTEDSMFSGIRDEAVFSQAAYDTAMKFVEAILQKKAQFETGEMDPLRKYNIRESIDAAFLVADKPQKNEVDRLSEIELGASDVKNYLLDAVKADSEKKDLKEGLKKGEVNPYDRLDLVKRKLTALSGDDMRLLLRVLQSRPALDQSTAENSICADQDLHDALFSALTGDGVIAGETLAGFDDNESCHMALMNALSFQIKDNAKLKDKTLAREHFAESSINRKTLVDWELIEKALVFVDQIKAKRAEIYAVSRAKDFIESSGNKNAIESHRDLVEKHGKNKAGFTRKKLEDKIEKSFRSTEHFFKDKIPGLKFKHEIDRVWSGYKSFTPAQKRLFVKVLQRRDLLDISSKNYVKSFFGFNDRNYVNTAGRNELLDEYIQASKNGGIGVALDDDAYYEAMRSLLSTQVSDDVNFEKVKDPKKIFASERNLFMQRDTDIDWKLFRRAVNFVTRATKELERREGDELLYQAAGDIQRYGRMELDYSFLRRNFHKTGNQWTRYIGRRLAKQVRDYRFKDLGLALGDIVETVDGYLKLSESKKAENENPLYKNKLAQGFDWLKRNVGDLNTKNKSLGKDHKTEYKSDMQNKGKTKEEIEKEKAENEEKERQRREERDFIHVIKEGFDNIVAEASSLEYALENMKGLLKDQLNLYILRDAKKEDASKDKSNIITSYLQEDKELAKKLSDVMNSTVKRATVKFVTFGSSKGMDFLKDNKAVDHSFKGFFEDIFGKSAAAKLMKAENFIFETKTSATNGINFVKNGAFYASKCVKHVKGIVKSLQNIDTLDREKEKSKTKRTEDDNKLKQGTLSGRINAAQEEKAKKILNEHRGLEEAATSITKAIQGFNIGSEAIDFAIETVNIAGGKLNYGQDLLVKAIGEGLEFVMFAARVLSDRKSLLDYFMGTEAGNETVMKIEKGLGESKSTYATRKKNELERLRTNYRSFKSLRSLKDAEALDIISDAQGYEHTSELVEDVGMQMAQSIIFCASDFNPMGETKLMAMAVMSVMGFSRQEIGKTSPDMVKRLFEGFKLAR